jgi:hypothetical protein
VDHEISRLRNIRVRNGCGFFLIVAFLGLSSLQMAGCGGGSGMQQPPPPPPPAFTNIDAPGAGATSPQGTFGIAISSEGAVAGYFIDANNVFHGFIGASGGTIATVDAPDASQTSNKGTEVTGVNASGEATGFYFDSGNILHSYVRSSSGTLTEFDPPNSTGSDAFCINDAGVIAGGVLDANGSHGFVRAADGTFASFDPTGNAAQVISVFPNAINGNGVTAGDYFDTNTVSHGFVRDAGGAITVFDAPGAGTSGGQGTQAFNISSSGIIVGMVTTGSSGGVAVTHSFIRQTDGTFQVFDPPGAGANGSLADGITDTGIIVGSFLDANLVRHGYLRSASGTFTVFDDPNAAQLAVSFTNLDTAPRRMNESGTVVGLYSDANGVRHAFIWQ